MIRGIRGAITVENNTKSEILNATARVLKDIISLNKIETSDIASVIFSLTEDLNAVFPAKAARIMGWEDVPLLCTREINVPDGMAKCIRILMHVNTNKSQKEIKNVYLEKAVNLRKETE